MSKRVLCVGALLLACCGGLSSSAFCQNARFEVEVRVQHLADAGKNDNSDVVIWLLPVGGEQLPAVTGQTHYRITQQNKEFHPHVLAVPVGTAVEFPNEDPFFHNVFSLYKGKRFDLGLYEAGSSRKVVFDKPGVSFIFCNIHPDMNAFVLALETPYFAKTDQSGRAEIKDLPFGRYRMEVWYERAESSQLAALARTIDVKAASVQTGPITIAESARYQPKHLNKHGKPYDPEPTPY